MFNESHDNTKLFKAVVFKKLENVINLRRNLAIMGFGDSQTGKTYTMGSIDKRGIAYKSLLEILSAVRHKSGVQL